MKIDPDTAAYMLHRLKATRPFADMLVTNRPEKDLWRAFDGCLLQLRLPLYHHRLGKTAPKPKLRDDALQACLALLAAFARAYGTAQAVVTARAQWVRAISFQPRPEGMNWTARYALDPLPGHPVRDPGEASRVTIADMLHLAAKASCVLAGYQAGAIAEDYTATFQFRRGETLGCAVVLREHSGRVVRAALQP